MKITICSHDGKGYFGGPYEWVKRFGPALRDRGVDVSFLFFSDHLAADSSTYLALKEQGFPCMLLPTHSFSQYHDNTEDRIRWFLKQVQQNPPDVLIANATLFALYAGRWLKSSGIPTVGVLHTDDPKGVWMQEEFLSGQEEFALSALVCVSDLLQQKVASLNKYGIPIEVISCGTPIPKKEVTRDRSVLKLVYAGKITEEAKQISLLTHAFCRAVKEIKGVEAYLYGDGPAKEDVLRIIAKEANGYPVFYKGFVESSEVQTHLLDKHVIVLLSDYEGLPIILLEGMACGLVPVCLDIRSGIPELVKQNETGFLVQDRGDDFVATIKKLKEETALFDRLSANAKSFVTVHHTMDVVTDKWIRLCNQLIKETVAKSSIDIPSRIELPEVHPLLKEIDIRKSSFVSYVSAQLVRLKRTLIKR